jgi:hypothetical protein
MNTISVTIQVPMRRVLDLTVNTFDLGHSSYWSDLGCGEFKLPEGFDVHKVTWLDRKEREESAKCRLDYFAALVESGELTVIEHGGSRKVKHRITLERVAHGLTVMARIMPQSFMDMVTENDDKYTADALWQCIVLANKVERTGDLIY